MSAQAIRKLAHKYPLLKSSLVGIEYLIKRTLAGGLWIVWRSRLHPFAFLRGLFATPGRYYIEQFLKGHAAECRGRFLEFGDPQYRDYFCLQHIEHYDISDVQPGPTVTIVGDIQACPEVPSDSYDVIVCTQVLEHVPNPFAAVAELHRILKPDGRLLLTVPACFPYHAVPRDYWRFTQDRPSYCSARCSGRSRSRAMATD
jgi:SAM-dependent methyltransferase